MTLARNKTLKLKRVSFTVRWSNASVADALAMAKQYGVKEEYPNLDNEPSVCLKCGCTLTKLEELTGICWECSEENGGSAC